eukprot:204153_1
MGQDSSRSSENIYRNKLMEVNDLNQIASKNDTDSNSIVQIWSTDILQIVISFCGRQEQYRLINLMFDHIGSNQHELSQVIQYNKIQIKPSIETQLIRDFNKKNSVLSAVEAASFFGFKFFFTNIIVHATPPNLEYLTTNKDNILLQFMHYVYAKKGGKKDDILKKNNTNVSLEVNGFVKAPKQMIFQMNDLFHSEEQKLDNIKYKNTYQFNTCERESHLDGYEHLKWEQFNDIFLKYLISCQLNHCLDGKKKDKQLMDVINTDQLGVLCGFSFNKTTRGLIGYHLKHHQSKHVSFVGARNQYHIKSKKVRITTKKTSSIFLFPQRINDNNLDSIGVPVITMVNPESQEHIEDKGKSVGKKIIDNIAYSAIKNI